MTIYPHRVIPPSNNNDPYDLPPPHGPRRRRQPRGNHRWLIFIAGIVIGIIAMGVIVKCAEAQPLPVPSIDVPPKPPDIGFTWHAPPAPPGPLPSDWLAQQYSQSNPVPYQRAPEPARPYAIDGDTFVNDMGQHIRLWGIDAPELNQLCDHQPVGQWARNYLAELLKGESLVCKNQQASNVRDRYGRMIAICTVTLKDATSFRRLDVGQTMVSHGYAFAYTRYTKAYLNDEAIGHDGPVHVHHCANPETYRRSK